jgi:DNA-binding NarL/FixJ family response regulator
MSCETQTTGGARILIVDDHPLVRQGIALLIQAEPDLLVCGQAGNADEALRALEGGIPDLALLDITMPGTNGIDLIRGMRQRAPNLRVLILSMHEESVYAERAWRAGASGYVMKHEPGAKLVEAIRAVLGGGLAFGDAVAGRIGQEPAPAGDGPVRAAPREIELLSNRELQVYGCIGQGMSSRQIAEQLGLSVKTVHVHREHIKRKLGYRGAPELVHHATHWVEASHGGGAGVRSSRRGTRPGPRGRRPPPRPPCDRR